MLTLAILFIVRGYLLSVTIPSGFHACEEDVEKLPTLCEIKKAPASIDGGQLGKLIPNLTLRYEIFPYEIRDLTCR